MNFYSDDSPIIACSTGASANTAISVIRLSGFKNLTDLQSVFSQNLTKLKPRFVSRTLIQDNSPIDDILLVFFPAPHSFTGENVLELNVHGNLFNVRKIIDLFKSKFNFREANPGEFTYRALKNKKLSLSQVEGLDLFLNATTPLSLNQGSALLYGELKQEYEVLYESFLKLKSSLEFHFDFLEDIGEKNANELFDNALREFSSKIDTLLRRANIHSSNLLSPEIVLFGEPNAGKSSLFNQFLGHRRSIVSDVPGTTRDFITEYIEIENINFKLVDTAGLRHNTNDLIEKEGIDLAISKLKNSFFNILVINPFENFDPFYLQNFKIDLVVVTHSDCSGFKNKLAPIEPLIRSYSNLALTTAGPIEPSLLKLITNKFNLLSKENPILIERQKSLIRTISDSIRNFNNLKSSTTDLAIIAQELNIIGKNIEELIGVIPADTVLNNIFSNFCIGK